MNVMIYDTGIGLIPFLQKAIQKKKYNNYYLYMDEDVFPLGNKPKEFIIEHLKYVLNFANQKYDILVLACNSLSSFLDYIDLSKYKIKIYSIFEENIKLLNKDVTFIGTSASTSNVINYPKIALDDLPFLIESNCVKEIIELINSIDINTNTAILGCTHFPLIKFIFEDLFPHITFISNEDAIVNKLPNSHILKVTGNEKAKKYLDIYLKKSNKILC